MRVGKYLAERADAYNIIISEVKKSAKTGEEYTSNLYYCHDWESACLRLLSLNIKSNEVKVLLKELKEIREAIIKEVKNSKLS